MAIPLCVQCGTRQNPCHCKIVGPTLGVGAFLITAVKELLGAALCCFRKQKARRFSGSEAATRSAASGPSPSPFFSKRIQSLSERRNTLLSDVELEIESSKSAWTEKSVETSDSDDEERRKANRVAFDNLKKDPNWGPFFQRQPYDLEIGAKIAEGGQAKIFEALGTNKYEYSEYMFGKTRLVVKVFKKGFSPEALQKWWPPRLAAVALPYRYFGRTPHTFVSWERPTARTSGLCFPVGAQLLDDGRFAFIFDRFWGDLRKLIDKRKFECNEAPPFKMWKAHRILRNIAEGMLMLHKSGLLHRDLKAANVLIVQEHQGNEAFIADFESSVGCSGTGFWRAPEVLLDVKNHSVKPETFTRESDVYSYAMTCYEVLTGLVPFEDHRTNDYDMILRGERPSLPDDIHPSLTDLVRKCWRQDPLQRPTFKEILADLETMVWEIEKPRQH